MQEVSETKKPLKTKNSTKRRDPLVELEDRAHLAYLFFGALAIATTFTYLQFSTKSICCGDFDGYYHIRWSQLLWEGMRHGHFPPVFKWLPLTTLNPKDYVDHHLLFHIFQIPFTWSGDLQSGAKIAAALFASLAVLSCFVLIVRYRIRYALVWLIALLACSAPFLYRMSMAKAPPFAIIYMIAGVYILFEKKYWALLPITFLFALTYDLFVLLPIATIVWVSVNFWSGQKFEWRPVMWVALGTIAGFVINPYFPKNAVLFAEHAAMKLNPAGFSTAVGQEWYPYESWYFLGSCFVAFAAMVTGYIAFDGSEQKRAVRPLFFLIISTLLLVINANWRRFVEYWPPFAVLFAAFSLQPVFDGGRSILGRLPKDLLQELRPFLDRDDTPENLSQKRKSIWGESEVAIWGAFLGLLLFCITFNARLARVIDQTTQAVHYNRNAVILMIIESVFYVVLLVIYFLIRRLGKVAVVFGVSLLTLIFFVNVSETKKAFGDDDKPDKYKSGMAWIRENVPAEHIVFNSEWDDFPKMFFYDTSHAYVSGLDPTYLLDRDANLSNLYVEITLGHVKDPGPLIRDRFGAQYVFTNNSKGHDDFYNNAVESGWFDRVYDDDDCSILKLRDVKGEPPNEEDENVEDENQGGSEEEVNGK
ncbi:MAG: hypothetical protein QOH96_2138 [Blastocatellia bacterium]|nr:hypothetical protein [Blastocatellia bacterium]